MKLICIASYLSIVGILAVAYMTCCTGCGYMPQILSDVEHVVDDTAITVKCSQEALSKNSDLKINVELNNSKP